MNFNITIIEDNPQEKERLLKALHIWEETNKLPLHIHDYANGEAYLEEHDTDEDHLYILDIQLSGMTGIDVAKKMRARGFDGAILFLTAFREYVFDGYDVRAMHYLLKPVVQEALDKCLDDILQQLKGNYFIFRNNPIYSLTAPTLTPFTKYFCKNGYAIMNGRIATIIAAFFKVSVLAPATAFAPSLP